MTIVLKHIPHLLPEDTDIIESLKKIDVLLISVSDIQPTFEPHLPD
jgi:hypothetical protein